MLLWQVIMDGEEYKDRNGVQLLLDDMQMLRRNGEIKTLAYDVCVKAIRENHSGEHGGIRRVVIDALQDTLSVDPRERPSALALLSRLQSTLPDEK